MVNFCYGQVRYFVLHDSLPLAIVDRLNTTHSEFAYYVFEAQLSSVIEVEQIVSKCFCICTGESMYVAPLHCNKVLDCLCCIILVLRLIRKFFTLIQCTV